MTLNRHNPRRDANEPVICDYLDNRGIPYWRMSGPGIPDLLILHKGLFKLLEVKTPTGRLKPAQVEFFTLCRDYSVKHLYVVRSIDDLTEALR